MIARYRLPVVFVVLLSALTACESGSTRGPTESPSSDLATGPLSLEATPMAGGAAQSQKSPSKDPGVLATSGPWLVLSDTTGIWALNADGSGLARVAERNYADPPLGVKIVPAPHGGVAAVLEYNSNFFAFPELSLISLPEGGWRLVASLVSKANQDATRDPELGPAAYDAAAAAGLYNLPAWSAEGRRLAFSGAIDGPTADLYLSALDDTTLLRLTDGPTQSVPPISWSPDGRYVIQGGASRTGLDSSGWGDEMDAIWAARADGSQATRLFPSSIRGRIYVLGWLSNTKFLADQMEYLCPYGGLRTVDLGTGDVVDLWSGSYDGRAFDPERRVLLFIVVEEEFARFPRHRDECIPPVQPGPYLLSIDGGSPRFIPDQGRITSDQVFWSPEAGRFYIYGERNLIFVSPEGSVSHFAAPALDGQAPIAVAPDGQRWAIVAADGSLWLGRADGDLREIFSGKASSPTWSPDGHTLFFLEGEGAKSLYLAHADQFAPAQIADGFTESPEWGNVTNLVWVEP